MDIQGNITVDLKDYGGAGQIVLAPLSLRRQNELANSLGSVSVGEYGEVAPVKMKLGDLSMIKVLVYVKSAPFGTRLDDLEPFFQYCDDLDEKQPGASKRLWERLNKAVEELEGRTTHPFAASEQSPTTTMD